MLDEKEELWLFTCAGVRVASADEFGKLQKWQTAMKESVDLLNKMSEDSLHERKDDEGNIMTAEDAQGCLSREGGVESLESVKVHKESLDFLDVSDLRRDQRRAYDMVDWHLNETLGMLRT